MFHSNAFSFWLQWPWIETFVCKPTLLDKVVSFLPGHFATRLHIQSHLHNAGDRIYVWDCTQNDRRTRLRASEILLFQNAKPHRKKEMHDNECQRNHVFWDLSYTFLSYRGLKCAKLQFYLSSRAFIWNRKNIYYLFNYILQVKNVSNLYEGGVGIMVGIVWFV